MDFSDFVGLPWKDRGRDAAGYDCYGLFRAVFRAGTGIELPSYADDYLTAADRADTAQLIGAGLDDWLPVARRQERAFDGALLRIAGGLHIGLIIAPGRMLHMPESKASVIEPLSRYDLVLTGLYRHARLA